MWIGRVSEADRKAWKEQAAAARRVTDAIVAFAKEAIEKEPAFRGDIDLEIILSAAAEKVKEQG